MRTVLALVFAVTAFVALVSSGSAAPVGSIQLNAICAGNPELTSIVNNTNEPLSLSGWTLGSLFDPRPNEPFALAGTLQPGESRVYQSGTLATQNVLTNQFIYSETNPTEGARLVTAYGPLQVTCAQPSANLTVGGSAPSPPSTVERPLFQNLTPAPYSTVAPGAVRLAVNVYGDTAIQQLSFKLNSVELSPEIGGPSEYQIAAFTERNLTAGIYNLTATTRDIEGDTFAAQWDFVVGEAGESAWFSASGQPKAGPLNATLRSLVEAFRWHLDGQSWDGANHPDLPSHVALSGQAPALETWVTGTTVNQAATEATLRSLVEAFRWHFYGQDWSPPYPPGPAMPTHAVSFSGPDSIEPWFTAGGVPLREPIEATLRSLVEAFRWHFWGASWDGSHHFEIPTHAYP